MWLATGRLQGAPGSCISYIYTRVDEQRAVPPDVASAWPAWETCHWSHASRQDFRLLLQRKRPFDRQIRLLFPDERPKGNAP